MKKKAIFLMQSVFYTIINKCLIYVKIKMTLKYTKCVYRILTQCQYCIKI